MFRRFLVVSSFVVLTLVLASWTRSWFAADTLSVRHSGMRWTTIGHACGVIAFKDMEGQWAFPVESAEFKLTSLDTRHTFDAVTHQSNPNTIDFSEFPSFVFDHGDFYLSVSLPHWLFAIAFGLFPLIRLFVLIKRRRDPVCKCGYDLRGTLSAGRSACPECGVDIKPRHLAAASPV